MTTVRGPVTVYINPFGVSSLSSNGSTAAVASIVASIVTLPLREARVVTGEDDTGCVSMNAARREVWRS
jgi:hypothetical protein